MRKLTLTLLGAVALAFVGALSSCSGGGHKVESTQTSGLTTIACDKTFENILQQEIDVFEYIYPQANVMPYYLDQNSVIDSLIDLKVKMAVMSRPLSDQEVAYLKSQDKLVRQKQIAVDAIALIVNPENPYEITDRKELVEILSGKLNKWGEIVPGGDKLGDVAVVFEHNGASTVQYVRDSIMKGMEFGSNVYAQNTPQEVFERVAHSKNAIGVIGVSWITDDLDRANLSKEELVAKVDEGNTVDQTFSPKIKVLKVRADNQVSAYKPYQYYIADGSYPFYRQIYLVTTGTNGTLSHGFYSFVTGYQGQRIMQLSGVLPKVLDLHRMVQLN
ncbi:MAG: substrate-binding domain-containing protein [Paramuribaculum sp.]|nr:substrate-binding domain-containing protein [Paramuribaculum sp.]